MGGGGLLYYKTGLSDVSDSLGWGKKTFLIIMIKHHFDF